MFCPCPGHPRGNCTSHRPSPPIIQRLPMLIKVSVSAITANWNLRELWFLTINTEMQCKTMAWQFIYIYTIVMHNNFSQEQNFCTRQLGRWRMVEMTCISCWSFPLFQKSGRFSKYALRHVMPDFSFPTCTRLHLSPVWGLCPSVKY